MLLRCRFVTKSRQDKSGTGQSSANIAQFYISGQMA
jgi:hypothetical protein